MLFKKTKKKTQKSGNIRNIYQNIGRATLLFSSKWASMTRLWKKTGVN